MIPWNYKNENKIFMNREKNGVPYLSFSVLEETGLVLNGFSTRLGGASREKYATMNFAWNKGDDPADVLENYTRMAKALGVDRDRMVASQQTHTTNVRLVTEEDAGKGVVRERDYTDVDGLITNVPDLTLATFYADCVPLYFVDPVHRAIGLSHSGWRGTAAKIGKVTVEKMNEEYGTDPKDIYSAIGPSICQKCYEVSEDVILEFQKSFEKKYWDSLFYIKENGKYQLNLWKANELIFLESGILPEHMAITNVCTHCNSKILYSHRTMGNNRGNLCAFLALK